MLDDPTHHPAPFPLFTLQEALPLARLGEIESLFEAGADWRRHDDHFYESFIVDVTAQLDADWHPALARRMVEHTGLELSAEVQITLQRMEPGDHAGVHTDRPLLGYEAARLVVHLNPDWTEADGGQFRAFEGDRPILEVWPHYNHAVGFALTADSLHEVTPAQRTRRSAVFHFWHAGNTTAVRSLADSLFAAMDFAALPSEVAELAVRAEAEHPEAATYRAAAVATTLLSWGYSAADAAEGYRSALSASKTPSTELEIAVSLARWLSYLYTEHFDCERWRRLQRQLVRLRPAQYPRLRTPWSLAFGTGLSRSMLSLSCAFCATVRFVDVNTGADALQGTFPTEAAAGEHAVLPHNTWAFTCHGCQRSSWAAFVDRRW